MRCDAVSHYTDGDFRRREHHGMSRDEVEGFIHVIISDPKILGKFCDVPDNKVAICYIIWLPIALPGFCIKNFLGIHTV